LASSSAPGVNFFELPYLQLDSPLNEAFFNRLLRVLWV
jgi:hypothetical protein